MSFCRTTYIKAAFILGIIQELPKLLTIALLGYYPDIIPQPTQDGIISTLNSNPHFINDPQGYICLTNSILITAILCFGTYFRSLRLIGIWMALGFIECVIMVVQVQLLIPDIAGEPERVFSPDEIYEQADQDLAILEFFLYIARLIFNFGNLVVAYYACIEIAEGHTDNSGYEEI